MSSGRTRRRIWTINGDFTTLRPTGVARYGRETTLALDRLIADGHPLAHDLSLELLVPRPVPDPLPVRSIPVRLVPEFHYPRLPQFWVQAQLPWHVRGGLLSFCNLAPAVLKRQIVCIHDMHTRMAPESYGRGFRWVHRALLPVLGRRAAAITTVSAFSRSRIAAYEVAPAGKITVTYNGSDHVAAWDENRSTLLGRADRAYVLCLGQRQQYKNTGLLLKLAPMLDSMGLDLWMAGDPDPAMFPLDSAATARNLRLLGRVGDDDLKAALAGALCFLFPSRIEGFGLPGVEAMAAGCPLVASTSPCLPEILGDAALYADPDEPRVWIGQILRLRDDPNLRDSMIEAGRKKAAAYTWRGVAETYLALMAAVDGLAALDEDHSTSSLG